MDITTLLEYKMFISNKIKSLKRLEEKDDYTYLSKLNELSKIAFGLMNNPYENIRSDHYILKLKLNDFYIKEFNDETMYNYSKNKKLIKYAIERIESDINKLDKLFDKFFSKIKEFNDDLENILKNLVRVKENDKYIIYEDVNGINLDAVTSINGFNVEWEHFSMNKLNLEITHYKDNVEENEIENSINYKPLLQKLFPELLL